MKERTKNLVFEGVLIVVSILVAFAIDAWWAERGERAEERRILESLRAEFQFNAESIPGFVERHAKTADHGAALIRALHEAGPGGAIQVEGLYLFWILDHSSTDPQRGALDAILQSGELRFIRSPRIRERLAAWPQLVVDATENEDLLRKTWGPRLVAAVAKNADLARLDEVPVDCFVTDPQEKCRFGEVSLPYDTEVIGFLLLVRGYSAEAALELDELAEEARNIVTLIDQELAAR